MLIFILCDNAEVRSSRRVLATSAGQKQNEANRGEERHLQLSAIFYRFIITRTSLIQIFSHLWAVYALDLSFGIAIGIHSMNALAFELTFILSALCTCWFDCHSS